MTAQTDEAARADSDLKAYCRAMIQPNGWQSCLRIEQRWGLDGYTPEIATTILGLIADGMSRDDAEAQALGQYEDDDPEAASHD